MRTLQLRIAAILVSAIVTVVIVSAFAAILLTGRPDPVRMIWPVASQIIAIDRFYDNGSVDDGGASEPTNLGTERADLTAALRERLLMDGVTAPVTVFDRIDDDTQIAVVELGGQKLGIEFPTSMPVPREIWLLLGTLLGLVVVGVTAVSLFMAYRVTRPFAMLEAAVNSVDTDGLLPHIPERGSGEARQTASVLNRLSERLRHAMESRMRLVAAAGHDLRTPMTRMRIRAEFLNDEDRVAWSRDIDELELIADSAIRLVKEEVSRDASVPISLDELLRDSVKELRAQSFDIELGPVAPALVTLPPLAIKRALRNLLINAAIHGKGGTASLMVTPDNVQLAIVDRGPGIPEHLLPRVFEPFFRAEPGRIQTTPGAGLGLAIAREIIERNGGSLNIRNGSSGGLVQEVTFAMEPLAAV